MDMPSTCDLCSEAEGFEDMRECADCGRWVCRQCWAGDDVCEECEGDQ
ncbi:MAG: hypothetical protein ACTSX8_10605 [Alphaproteobacteria bacterium]